MPTKLIQDLSHVPGIIAGLGLGVADAQSHFNHAYLEGLERLLVMAQSLLGQPAKGAGADDDKAAKARLEEFRAVLTEMLVALAPPRYQFTETTLTVKLDLAQSLDMGVSAGASVGVNAGVAAVAVNASMSVAFGYDYRAAAECRTVIHASPPNEAVLRTLLARAAAIGGNNLELPERSTVDSAVLEQAQKVYERLVGAKPAAEVTEKSETE